MSRGKFIVLEGMDGSGKSTVSAALTAELDARRMPYVHTREPGGTPLGEGVRKLLLESKHGSLTDKTELLLMFAARAQHVEQLIKPALTAGRHVLSDRFTDSSYAYQGYARGLGVEAIAWLETFVQETLRPDLTIFLDAPVEVSRTRQAARSGERDRIEQEADAFFERARAGYLEQARRVPERYAVIDATQPVECVVAEAVGHLRRALASPPRPPLRSHLRRPGVR